MITIEQNPPGLMGSNMDHIFTLSSTNSSLTNFKYVIDVWFNPYQISAQKIGRVKVRPNTYSKGIINVRDIIRNYITANPRVSGSTYSSTNGTTWTLRSSNQNGNMSILSGFSESNVYNSTTSYPTLNHTGSYRILVGEEYTSGSTTILNIPTEYWVPTDAQNLAQSLDSVASSYAGTPNRINWSGMNSWDFGTGYGVFTSGYTYQHWEGSTLITSGTSVNDSGNYYAAGPPNVNDRFYVWSNQLGCGFEFVWNCDGCETTGWNYVGTYSPEATPICSSASDLIRLTPTADVEYTNDFLGDAFDYSTQYANTRYMSKFYLSPLAAFGTGVLEEQSRYGNFLNKFGVDKKPFDTNGITISNDYKEIRFRHRQHHRECPIVLNFINGNCGDSQFAGLNPMVNSVGSLVELHQTGNTLDYKATHIPSYIASSSNVYTDLDYLITNFGKFVYDTAELDVVNKIGFYTSTTGTSTNYTTNGSSLIYVYELYGDECLYGDAVHFLYLNTNGGWDTITFGQKNIKSVSTKRDVYAQQGIRDTNSYRWSSYEQRNITYNQDTIVSVEAQSVWVDENDVPNFRDFFLSNYVYQIVKNENANGTLSSTLIPITITDNTFEEYKQRYNKLYQYSMNYQYNTINQFNTSL